MTSKRTAVVIGGGIAGPAAAMALRRAGPPEKSVNRDDRLQRASVRTLWRVDENDDSHYTTVLDASRLPDDRLVRILLDAAGLSDQASAAGDPALRPGRASQMDETSTAA